MASTTSRLGVTSRQISPEIRTNPLADPLPRPNSCGSPSPLLASWALLVPSSRSRPELSLSHEPLGLSHSADASSGVCGSNVIVRLAPP